MAQQRQATAAERVTRVREQIERWRCTRAQRSPMPAQLWEEAVSLAGQLGVHPVKAALRLNYESLKKRVASRPGTKASAAARTGGFVELSGAQLFAAPDRAGAVVEVSGVDGARLTVRLAAGSELDVSRLVEAFRRREQ